MAPPKSVDLAAGPVLYDDNGEGAPIVFVHGVFVNGKLWRKVAERLSTGYRCIVPDWPMGSHSQPMKDEADLSTPGLARIVAEFLESLDLHDVILVGNDTGGAVCQLVMVNHPERVGRVVLTSCDAFEVYPPKPFSFLHVVPSVPGLAFLLAQAMRFSIVRRLPIAYGWVMKTLPKREVLDSYTRPLLGRAIRRDAKKMLRGLSRDHTIDAAARLGGFDKPALLAWGGEDKLFPVSLAERLAAVLPKARVQIIPAARTFVAEDRPAELAAAITGFIRSDAGGAQT